ncbi:MAG: intradiol ring-cleavage dioxygenase [Rhodospirillales bacterium]|nr:intradiol ring-cleavage dioxygenase [Rhodospirillales bacterium]
MTARTVTRRLAVAGLASIAAGAAAAPLHARAGSTLLGYEASGPAADRGIGLAAPPECTHGTRSSTAGPFYTPLTPQRDTLREPDTRGEPLAFEGLVLAHDCRPLAGAVIDIWHCDERGHYDNRGFRYRGHQFTDAAGAFRFETIRPVRYSGRTPHIHVKAQGEATPVLTTQVYFPDLQEANAGDRIFRDDLVMHLDRAGDGWRGRFDFVLPPA